MGQPTTSVADIDGAFGFKLGEVFTPESGAKSKMLSGLEVYRVTPKIPNPTFSIYEIHVSVTSRKICQISAEGESTPDGATFRKVQTFLARKYGGEITKDGSSFEKNGRFALLESMATQQDDMARFKVTYTDTELYRAAYQEFKLSERTKLIEGFDGAGL